MKIDSEQSHFSVVAFDSKGEFTKLGQPAIFRNAVELVEAPTLWLDSEFAKIGGRESVNTWHAAANAIKSWLEFCDASEISWEAAEREDLHSYREAFRAAISPHTQRAYATGTIALRLTYICDFYRWFGRGHIIDEQIVSGGGGQSLDQDSLAHLRGGQVRKKRNRILPVGAR